MLFKGVADLLKRQQMIVGILTALAFQIIFSVVWMTGYQGGNDRIKDFQIAIVNEDRVMGTQIVQRMKESLPFRISIVEEDIAREKLVAREVQMVMTIPAQFTDALQDLTAPAQLLYEINESNPALVKSVMDSAATAITGIVDHEATIIGIQSMLGQLSVPTAQVEEMAGSLAERVKSEMTYIHPVDGLNNQMVPMMMVLASFVGAMIMGMNMQQASLTLVNGLSKWDVFKARTIINIVSALAISLMGTSLVMALGGQSVEGFMTLWLLLGLIVWVFLVFTQLFLILFGMAGMLFNITLLSLQLVTSGAIIPRTLLGTGFQAVGEFLPATYAIEGLMNVLFGGVYLEKDIWALVTIALISLAVSAGMIALRKTRHSEDKENIHSNEIPAST